ncbi:site-specific DNA-methyltransferase [Pseudoalteromonas sp. AOP31-A2-14]|uniref:site-specific DNA-methyltransferase n=1 Tax=Pseudoalteromonas sp. AOP31-A2-14 TaxID=3457695 RepID=UPI0040361B8D
MDKLKMHSPDLSQSNIEKIKELFPNCVTEATDNSGNLKLTVDFDQLKQELSDSIVEGPQERYQLNWPGKREALLTANAPIAKTLRPCREESVNFDKTENLFIEGDNLEALKLLQETYLGKVKMIYIDPPYNTGNDFIYKDDFSIETERYLKVSKQTDDVSNKLITNTESNGRFHSDWLTMIYPRLKLAKNLLSEDGVIFVSIDESEYSNLIKLMEEVFGENNSVCTFVWKTRQASGKQVAHSNTSVEHEYIVAFSKTPYAKLKGVERDASTYKNPDKDPRGIWAKHPLDVGSTAEERPNCFYTLIDPNTGIKYEANPNRVWAYAPESMQKLIAEGKVIFHPEGKTKPMLKKFFNELKTDSKPISSWLQKDIFNIGYNTEGTKKANELFDNKKLFDYPKPISLIKLLISQTLEDHEIVLDFFAGSATTGHALLESNLENKLNNTFILVQIPQTINEKTLAYKEGYRVISELSAERLRRVIEKNNLNEGFRFLKVDSSNMTSSHYTPGETSQEDMFAQIENIKEGRTDEDLLFQVLLDWGVGLTLPITQQKIEAKDVFFVNVDDEGENADLIACFGKDISNELIKTLAEKQPLRVVFRDDGFVNDSVKINVEQIFKQISPMTDVKSI